MNGMTWLGEDKEPNHLEEFSKWLDSKEFIFEEKIAALEYEEIQNWRGEVVSMSISSRTPSWGKSASPKEVFIRIVHGRNLGLSQKNTGPREPKLKELRREFNQSIWEVDSQELVKDRSQIVKIDVVKDYIHQVEEFMAQSSYPGYHSSSEIQRRRLKEGAAKLVDESAELILFASNIDSEMVYDDFWPLSIEETQDLVDRICKSVDKSVLLAKRILKEEPWDSREVEKVWQDMEDAKKAYNKAARKRDESLATFHGAYLPYSAHFSDGGILSDSEQEAEPQEDMRIIEQLQRSRDRKSSLEEKQRWELREQGSVARFAFVGGAGLAGSALLVGFGTSLVWLFLILGILSVLFIVCGIGVRMMMNDTIESYRKSIHDADNDIEKYTYEFLKSEGVNTYGVVTT